MPFNAGTHLSSRQRGAFMVMMAILVVVLIGIAALVLDVGRVLALRAEMQNAVDAAALAGAVELNGQDGARLRARAAARNALLHDSRYARISELLGDASLPDEAFDFFCVIGSRDDVNPGEVNMAEYCPAGSLGDGYYGVAADRDAHYIRVRLDPELAEAGRFTVDLIFLPVLRVLGIEPATFVSLNAMATAGRHFYACNYPPMMLCDPFEGTGTHLKYALVPGQAIVLRDQGGAGASWAPGNFGFLQPRGSGPGAPDLAKYLASADDMGCTPPTITTSPGETAQKTKAAINTRFDEYPPPLPNPGGGVQAWEAWPPAPNIVDYPSDSTWQVIAGMTDRFGNGDWDFDGYWAAKHPGVLKPNTWSNLNRPKRWDVYQWEIENGMIPEAPTHTPGDMEGRRVLRVAVTSCTAQNVAGKSSATLMEPDGFAKMFITKRAADPGSPAKLEIVAEYLGWSLEQDANYHVQIQLYQ